jgi:hypothetical protein
MMTIKIAIENGRSLKLCQTHRVNVKFPQPHPLQAQNRPITKITQPTSGLQGGLGAGREGRGVDKEYK